MKKWVKNLIFFVALGTLGSTAVAGEAMRQVIDTSKLNVCAWAPYGGVTTKHADGSWTGLDVDMAHALAASFGASATFVDSGFATFADQLAKGECHIAMFGIGRTLPRAQQVTFSEPYLASGLHAVVNGGKSEVSSWDQLDLPGKTIAVTKNTFVEAFMGQYLKNAKMLAIAPTQWVGALEDGSADALVTDFVFATKLKHQFDWATVISLQAPLSQTTYGYAVAPKSVQLLGYVNLFLSESKRNGDLAELARKHDLTALLYNN